MNNITSKEFDDFVKREKSAATTESLIDWDKERTDWTAHLDSLYKQIETFLSKYTAEGSIRIEYKDLELNEENIGTYVVRKMIIHIGRQEVTLTPIGTMLIGSKGRVDVEGGAGKARLTLVDKDAVDARSMIRVKSAVDARSMISVKVTIGTQKSSEPEKEAEKNIEWAWKIATSPPVIRFIDLNAESFFQMIMEVSNA